MRCEVASEVGTAVLTGGAIENSCAFQMAVTISTTMQRRKNTSTGRRDKDVWIWRMLGESTDGGYRAYA